MNRSLWLFALLCLSAVAEEPKALLPMPRAHAHNDYEHQRPLLDALEHGFCSVEADVWLIDGHLLVAHDRNHARSERTLEALYLDPLRDLIATNGGRVYRGGPTLTLLIDVKSDATNTYAALRDSLRPYQGILTTFHKDRTQTNALTVIVSGNRARELMAAETSRFAGYDGRLDDLDSNASPHLIPLISDNWTRHFKWTGKGPLPDDERQKLKGLVSKAHTQGRRLRLWGTPDTPAVWSELLSAEVDLVNIDDLGGFKRFFHGLTAR